MKIESMLKHLGPKGMSISDSSRATATTALTGTDTMAAAGMVESRAQFGMAAYLGKCDISDEDKIKAIAHITQFAKRTAPKLVGKVSGRRLARCMQILATLAFDEYCRSAASGCTCKHCDGKGLIYAMRDVVKHPGITTALGEEIFAPWIVNELTGKLCQHCNGKGITLARCRCKGTGKVLDRKETKELGAPVIRKCERCSGKGFSRMPSSVAHNAVKALIPDLTQSSWSRNWKPFYESLVSKCFAEESWLETQFSRVTR